METQRIKEIADQTWAAIVARDTDRLEALLVEHDLWQYDIAVLRYTFRVRKELAGWEPYRDKLAIRLQKAGESSSRHLRGLY